MLRDWNKHVLCSRNVEIVQYQPESLERIYSKYSSKHFWYKIDFHCVLNWKWAKKKYYHKKFCSKDSSGCFIWTAKVHGWQCKCNGKVWFYYNNSDYLFGHAKHLAKCDKCKAVRVCEWIGFGWVFFSCLMSVFMEYFQRLCTATKVHFKCDNFRINWTPDVRLMLSSTIKWSQW